MWIVKIQQIQSKDFINIDLYGVMKVELVDKLYQTLISKV